MHLVGSIIRIYHDARSSECQMSEMRSITNEIGVKLIKNEDLHSLKMKIYTKNKVFNNKQVQF